MDVNQYICSDCGKEYRMEIVDGSEPVPVHPYNPHCSSKSPVTLREYLGAKNIENLIAEAMKISATTIHATPLLGWVEYGDAESGPIGPFEECTGWEAVIKHPNGESTKLTYIFPRNEEEFEKEVTSGLHPDQFRFISADGTTSVTITL